MIRQISTLFDGCIISLEVFALTLLFSVPLGFPLAAGRMSRNKIVSGVVNAFLLVIRGTPLMLQLILVYFTPGFIIKYLNEVYGLGITARLDRFVAAIIALSVNYACYFAEIYRGGFQSIPQGQYEASKVLGYTEKQTFFRIILPQVIKRIIPPMGNEVITLVKDTALVSVIGVVELLRTAQTISSKYFSTTPIFVAGLFYFVMNWVVSTAFIALEKKLNYYK